MTVLPHRLHGAVAPAVALPPQLPRAGRRFGPGARLGCVDDPPARAADRHGQIGVLGEGVAADPTDVDERLTSERADRARDRRHASEHVEHSPVEVEADDVFDVLPPTQQATSVADLGVARHGADLLRRERGDERPQRVALEDGVSVNEDEDRVLGVPDTGLEGGRLAGVHLPDQTNVGQVETRDDRRCVVGRAVIDDDDLQLGRVGAGRQRSDAGLDPQRLVVRGYDHRHRGQLGGGRRGENRLA